MLKVLISTDTRYPVNRKIIRAAVEDTIKKYKIESADFEVSVAVVGARKMKQLTDKYAGDEAKHQILTFALEEDAPAKDNQGLTSRGFVNAPQEVLSLGDIVLSWPEVLAEASADDVMVGDKIYELVCHGTEHLLGYNHK